MQILITVISVSYTHLALTALTGVVIGDVYNVVAAGTLNGEAFEAGSNFVAIKAGAGNQ